MLVFRDKNGQREEEFESLDAAAAAFESLYGEYPTVVKQGNEWFPNPHHRVSGDMTNYGKEIFLYYQDDRRKSWQVPCCDKTGRFYRGAFTEQATPHVVPGYGYMHRGEEKGVVPIGTVHGNLAYNATPGSVNIGGILVPQEEMDRVYRETGLLPTHVTVWNPSGSCLELSEIIWGEEPQIIAAEQAASEA